MGVHRATASVALVCALFGGVVSCSADEPETGRVLEHSCDRPDAPADELFVRTERSSTEIRWAGGDWHEVSDAQYDKALFTLCYD